MMSPALEVEQNIAQIHPLHDLGIADGCIGVRGRNGGTCNTRAVIGGIVADAVEVQTNGGADERASQALKRAATCLRRRGLHELLQLRPQNGNERWAALRSRSGRVYHFTERRRDVKGNRSVCYRIADDLRPNWRTLRRG